MKPLPKDQLTRVWLALAAAATILVGTAYTLVQQSTRLEADDLPLVTAQVARQQLEGGAQPSDVVPANTTDLKSDNSVFVIVTDNQEHILASSAKLDGTNTLPPKGTFDYAAKHGTDHFTWQPTNGARLATRILPYAHGSASGFVITGQSLSQAESRITMYGWIALAAWAAVLIVAFLILWFPL